MKRFILTTLAFLFAFAAGAQQVADLEKTILSVQRESGMQHGMLAVCVYNISRGQEVYSYNSDLSMTPASVNKLLTTGVAFSQLGSDFRFTTRIGIRGEIDREGVLHGNIYIIGGGDPMLGSYRYRQTSPDTLFDGWTRALKKKGIKRVDGRVCYHIGVFDEQPLHDSWPWGDVGNYYGAGVCGLNFHENMYFVFFNPGNKIGYPASCVRVSPKNVRVHGVCEVTTGPEGSGDNVIIYGSPTDHERIYRGTVPLGKNDFRVRGAMPNPAKQCADLFASYLRTHGVSVSSNSMQVYTQPDSLRIVLDYYSSDYYTIAQYTNLTSNNIYAEATPQNKVTAYFLCRYLAAMSKEPFFNEFLHTLSKVGENGTAKNLLSNLPAGIAVRLKTGSMDGVKAYAGYINAANGDRLAFAIISNGHDANSTVAGEKLNKILQKVVSIY